MSDGASRSHPSGAADLPTVEDRPRRAFVRFDRDWGLAMALPFLGLLMTWMAQALPQQVETLFSRGLYPKVAHVLHLGGRAWAGATGGAPTDLSSRSPSLAESLLCVAAALILVLLWRAVRRGIGPLLRRMCVIGGAIYLAYLMTWGLNHARVPLAETLGLDTRPVSLDELDGVALELERDLATLLKMREQNGELPGWQSTEGPPVATLAGRAWADALSREPMLGWQPDPVVCAPALSGAMTAASITGIFIPFTQEAHVAAGMPLVDRAFTACHEIAHAQGWAREDEANYLAWRVGSRSEHPALREAALMMALHHVHRALRRADPLLQRKRALAFDVRIAALMEHRSAYWQKNRSPAASRAVGAVNNTYLKSQGHRAGVASYGRMVDLLVAELR